MNDNQKQAIIRLGMMCEGTVFSDWKVRCLKRLQDLGCVRTELLIIDESTSQTKAIFRKLKRALTNLNWIFFYIYFVLFCKPRSYRHIDMPDSF